MKKIIQNKKCVLLLLIVFSACKETTTTENWFLDDNSNDIETAMVLGPGVISSSQIEYGGGISEKYKEVYFTINDTTWQSSYAAVCKYENGKFISRDTVRFAGKTMQGGDAHLSPDGERLFISSRFSKDTTQNDGNIWVAKREPNGWSKAIKLTHSINTELGEYSPSQSNSGNLYFTRFSEESSGDIYVSNFINGEYQRAVKLPQTINSNFVEADSWVSPDESFILFTRRPEDGYGLYDNYISFNIDGEWSEAKNLGAAYNSFAIEGSPSLTHDLKYLIFTSNRGSESANVFDGSLDIYIQKFNLKKIRRKLLEK